MAFSSSKLFEVQTRNPSIVVEVHAYTKLAGDATGTVTRGKGRRIRRIIGKSDTGASASIAANRTDVNLSALSGASTHSLNGMLAIEVERI